MHLAEAARLPLCGVKPGIALSRDNGPTLWSVDGVGSIRARNLGGVRHERCVEVRFLRKSAKFDDWFVDGMPDQYSFDVDGTTYELRACEGHAPPELFPLERPVRTRFSCNFRSPNGAEVEILGRASFRTKTVNHWGVGTDYYSVRDRWTFSVSVSGTLVAEGLTDVANIHDERLRNVIYDAHAAIAKGSTAAWTEANNAAQDERDAAKRKADERTNDINEKLDKL